MKSYSDILSIVTGLVRSPIICDASLLTGSSGSSSNSCSPKETSVSSTASAPVAVSAAASVVASVTASVRASVVLVLPAAPQPLTAIIIAIVIPSTLNPFNFLNILFLL